jgi:hypothetical protein
MTSKPPVEDVTEDDIEVTNAKRLISRVRDVQYR